MAFTQERDTGLVDKLVNIGRVAKVVKGGRRFSFSAIVVVGDEGGRVGWGSGKAKEVPEAVRKATDAAKRRMVRVPMRSGRTIHHDINGRFGASRVMMKPAKPGTGIIAGGPMRAVFEAMGIKDVVSKSVGSNNPYNLIQATFDAFDRLETPRGVAAKRGLKPSDLKAHKEIVAVEVAQEQEAEAARTQTDEKKDEKPAKKAKKSTAKKAPAKKAAEKKDTADKGAKKADTKKAAPKSATKAEAKSESKGEKAAPKGKDEETK